MKFVTSYVFHHEIESGFSETDQEYRETEIDVLLHQEWESCVKKKEAPLKIIDYSENVIKGNKNPRIKTYF